MSDPTLPARQFAIPLLVEQMMNAQRQIEIWRIRRELFEVVYKAAMAGSQATLEDLVKDDPHLRESLLSRVTQG